MNTKTMNKLKIFSFLLVITASISTAQEIEPVKKAIDAEQYEKAKSMLKTLIKSTNSAKKPQETPPQFTCPTSDQFKSDRLLVH